MFNSKFNGLLTGLLIAAIIGILILIGFFGWSVYSKYYIDSKAKDMVDTFEQTAGKNENTVEEDGNRAEIGGVAEGNSIYTNGQGNSSKMTYYGYEVLGTISIPKIDLNYPILENASPQAIKVAVGYMSGVGINKPGNTVIQGHNYRNGQFFSNLKKLVNGDSIYITDQTGLKVEYKVYNKFDAESTDTSFFKRDTGGLREITLSTCTDDGKLRTIILAKEV